MFLAEITESPFLTVPISLYTLKAAGDLAFNIDNELIGSKSASGCALAVTSVLTLGVTGAASTAGAGVSCLATVVFLAVLFFVVLFFVCASTEKTLNANSKI